MEVYSVLCIKKDLKTKVEILGIFKNFEKAKEEILYNLQFYLEEYQDSWYKHNGTKTLKDYENDLDSNWEIKSFDTFQIKKHVISD